MADSCELEELDFIYQGDTGPILQVRPSVLDDLETISADWHCFIGANYKDGSVAAAPIEIHDLTADLFKWIAALTPDQTAEIVVPDNGALDVIMVLEVKNSTTVPPFNVETHYILPVKAQGIP